MSSPRHWLARLVLVIAAAMTVAACGGSDTATVDTGAAADAAPAASADGATAESALPAVSGPTVNGGQLAINDLEGQDVVLWFWAPW